MIKISPKRTLIWASLFLILLATVMIALRLMPQKDPYSSTLYTNTADGYSIKVPSGWSKEQLPNATLLKGKDTAANIEVSLLISRNPEITQGCSNIAKDSQKLSFKGKSLAVSSSYLSFFSMQQTPKTLCSVMLTGNTPFKAGDAINPQDYTVISKLPDLRVVAQINNLDSSTNFPTLEAGLSSRVYDELLFSIKSLQITK